VAQKFKYNSVEFEESLGLNLYEMDFRNYDPAIGRFMGIDPVIHFNQGTSVAFDNNPIYWADPSGADGEHYNFNTGTYQDGSGNKITYEEAFAAYNLNPDGSKKNDDPECPPGEICTGGKGEHRNELKEIIVDGGKTHNRSNYEYSATDRNLLKWLKANMRSLYEEIRKNNAKGIYYPLTSGVYRGFGPGWNAGWNSWESNDLGNHLMDFSAITIAGTMVAGAGASMFGGSAISRGAVLDSFYSGLANSILNFQRMTGVVSGGSGTTILLGRDMKNVINPTAAKYGWTTISSTIPAWRPLAKFYNEHWMRFHLSAGSQIRVHINAYYNNLRYSEFMGMELRMIREHFK
jgi:RHS repeat-associated protein